MWIFNRSAVMTQEEFETKVGEMTKELEEECVARAGERAVTSFAHADLRQTVTNVGHSYAGETDGLAVSLTLIVW